MIPQHLFDTCCYNQGGYTPSKPDDEHSSNVEEAKRARQTLEEKVSEAAQDIIQSAILNADNAERTLLQPVDLLMAQRQVGILKQTKK